MTTYNINAKSFVPRATALDSRSDSLGSGNPAWQEVVTGSPAESCDAIRKAEVTTPHRQLSADAKQPDSIHVGVRSDKYVKICDEPPLARDESGFVRLMCRTPPVPNVPALRRSLPTFADKCAPFGNPEFVREFIHCLKTRKMLDAAYLHGTPYACMVDKTAPKDHLEWRFASGKIPQPHTPFVGERRELFAPYEMVQAFGLQSLVPTYVHPTMVQLASAIKDGYTPEWCIPGDKHDHHLDVWKLSEIRRAISRGWRAKELALYMPELLMASAPSQVEGIIKLLRSPTHDDELTYGHDSEDFEDDPPTGRTYIELPLTDVALLVGGVLPKWMGGIHVLDTGEDVDGEARFPATNPNQSLLKGVKCRKVKVDGQEVHISHQLIDLARMCISAATSLKSAVSAIYNRLSGYYNAQLPAHEGGWNWNAGDLCKVLAVLVWTKAEINPARAWHAWTRLCPGAEGYYAVGLRSKTPPEARGDILKGAHIDVKNRVSNTYLARCLWPEIPLVNGIPIGPGFAPQINNANCLAFICKRVARKGCATRPATRLERDAFIRWLCQHVKPVYKTPEEIKKYCDEFAEVRFAGKATDIQAYKDGVKRAYLGLPPKPEWGKLYKMFFKKEMYYSPNTLRGICCPEVEMRGYSKFACLLAEMAWETDNPHISKGLNQEELKKRVSVEVPVYQQDGSGFECLVNNDMLTDQGEVLSALAPDYSHLIKWYYEMINKPHAIKGPGYFVSGVPPMTISGSETTSVGNALSNLEIFFITCLRMGIDLSWDDWFMVEGDDLIFDQAILSRAPGVRPDMIRSTYERTATELGMVITIDAYTSGLEANFLGFHLSKKVLHEREWSLCSLFDDNVEEVLVNEPMDPYQVLSKISWCCTADLNSNHMDLLRLAARLISYYQLYRGSSINNILLDWCKEVEILLRQQSLSRKAVQIAYANEFSSDRWWYEHYMPEVTVDEILHPYSILCKRHDAKYFVECDASALHLEPPSQACSVEHIGNVRNAIGTSVSRLRRYVTSAVTSFLTPQSVEGKKELPPEPAATADSSAESSVDVSKETEDDTSSLSDEEIMLDQANVTDDLEVKGDRLLKLFTDELAIDAALGSHPTLRPGVEKSTPRPLRRRLEATKSPYAPGPAFSKLTAHDGEHLFGLPLEYAGYATGDYDDNTFYQPNEYLRKCRLIDIRDSPVYKTESVDPSDALTATRIVEVGGNGSCALRATLQSLAYLTVRGFDVMKWTRDFYNYMQQVHVSQFTFSDLPPIVAEIRVHQAITPTNDAPTLVYQWENPAINVVVDVVMVDKHAYAVVPKMSADGDIMPPVSSKAKVVTIGGKVHVKIAAREKSERIKHEREVREAEKHSGRPTNSKERRRQRRQSQMVVDDADTGITRSISNPTTRPRNSSRPSRQNSNVSAQLAHAVEVGDESLIPDPHEEAYFFQNGRRVDHFSEVKPTMSSWLRDALAVQLLALLGVIFAVCVTQFAFNPFMGVVEGLPYIGPFLQATYAATQRLIWGVVCMYGTLISAILTIGFLGRLGKTYWCMTPVLLLWPYFVVCKTFKTMTNLRLFIIKKFMQVIRH